MTVLKGFDFSKKENINNASETNEEKEHFFRYVKADEEIQVGLLAPTEYANLQVYDIYPITKGAVQIPKNDLFAKAKAEMMRLSDIAKMEALGVSTVKEATDMYNKMAPTEKESFKKTSGGAIWHHLIREAYRLATQERFLFGFYDFKTGSPFVIQTTKKQAEGIYKQILDANTPKKEGAKSSAEKFAYIIRKGTGGFKLEVDTDTEIAELSEEEKYNHEQWRKQEISEEQFSTAHFELSEEGIQDVIKTFASDHPEFVISNVFTVEEKKEEKSSLENPFYVRNEGQPLDISDDDLPF
ncbi:hypothetical protein BC7_00071 [Bacillus phage BC-7]|nr:hypothetical protein BC7_00071 [Bacillus phage BC-7]